MDAIDSTIIASTIVVLLSIIICMLYKYWSKHEITAAVLDTVQDDSEIDVEKIMEYWFRTIYESEISIINIIKIVEEYANYQTSF